VADQPRCMASSVAIRNIPHASLFGINMATVSAERAVATVLRAADEGRVLEVHLCNAFTLSLVDRDVLLRDALACAHMNLPDGAPVAWLLRRHGVKEPVRGASLFRDVARAGASREIRHFLFGGAPGVAALAATRLRASGVTVVGAETAPFRDLSDGEISELATRVRGASAQVVWIGMGTPRQDHVVPRLGSHVECPIVPVGAAFDFVSGRVEEAPAVLHGSGFEWMYRLYREPRRLWRRYLRTNPKFAMMALQHIVGGRGQ